MVVAPVAVPVSVNVPLVAPAANGTLAGVKVTRPAGSVRLTVTPPVGAGLVSVRTPLRVRVTPTIAPDSDTLTAGGATLTVAVPGVKPVAIAVIVVLPAPLPGVTGTLTPPRPAGTVTLA